MFATAARLMIALIAFASVLFLFLILAQVAASFGAFGVAIGFCLVVAGGYKAVETAAEVWSIS